MVFTRLLCLVLLALLAPFADASDFEGDYTCPDDGSTLTIREHPSGGYSVEIALYRLTLQDDGQGVLEDDALYVTATDASGSPIIWKITQEGENLRAEVMNSSWPLLPEGEEFVFEANQ